MSKIESHPLEPFLPQGTKLLMLGSFPPPQNRWCMPFYYPNFNNDMWRILGKVFFDEREHFVLPAKKCFDKSLIESFLKKVGIGIFDTASAVIREKGNASDAFLQVVTPTDVRSMLLKIPHCLAVNTTGTLATETVCAHFGIEVPRVGEKAPFFLGERKLFLYRTLSSSRAYPLALEKKAAAYRKMFEELGMLAL